MNTRQLIIETAADLFYRKGYNLTGINEVIATAGIAKATLYSHFRSKEDLCVAYLEHRDEGLMEELRSFCLAKPQGKDRVIAVIDFLHAFYQNKGFNGCWCLRTIAEVPPENIKIREKIRSQKKGLLNFMKDLVRDNLLHRTDTEQERIANQTYLLYEGAITESYLYGEDWPITEAREMVKAICQ